MITFVAKHVNNVSIAHTTITNGFNNKAEINLTNFAQKHAQNVILAILITVLQSTQNPQNHGSHIYPKPTPSFYIDHTDLTTYIVIPSPGNAMTFATQKPAKNILSNFEIIEDASNASCKIHPNVGIQKPCNVTPARSEKPEHHARIDTDAKIPMDSHIDKQDQSTRYIQDAKCVGKKKNKIIY